jgi:hypothetical protein
MIGCTDRSTGNMPWLNALAASVLFACIAMHVGASEAGETDYRIVSPTTSEPVGAEPGGLVQILVRLRLPLTPPPGVQRLEALEGWRISVKSKDAVTAAGRQVIITYPAHLIRIRPAEKDLYRISVELAPWALPGRYDLSVEGPGFSAEQPDAVSVGRPQPIEQRQGVETTRLDSDSLILKNMLSHSVTTIFDIVVPARLPGLAVDIDKSSATPSVIAWAAPPDLGRIESRVLRFDVEIPAAIGSEPGRTIIKWSGVEKKTCRARIDLIDADEGIDPMSSTDLRMAAEDFAPIAVIWDFGDGKWGVGNEVRHRFLTSEKATFGAAAFDRFGRVCKAVVTERLVLPVERSGCSCGSIGAR